MTRNRPDEWGWWDWQVITNGRAHRLYISYGWIFAFLPLAVGLLIGWALS